LILLDRNIESPRVNLKKKLLLMTFGLLFGLFHERDFFCVSSAIRFPFSMRPTITAVLPYSLTLKANISAKEDLMCASIATGLRDREHAKNQT